ncbi:carbohydrate ABC transporter permease [Phytohabitans houttuyneae]|uniref:Sugar ABC transporter permease n=1 Tax=Phytohabitans houttuyneae TaxID=1076126 RepID=A0A6V8KFP8_9ACTN|nr:sugar ABC transporter permease [Phytohabitans houttuyneae]GFJ80856.1 sugar ABC transporter permease [Phytohabitans houttuyneae]
MTVDAAARRRAQLKIIPWLLMAPTMVGIALVIGYPFVRTVWLSLHEGRGLRTGEWVGLHNYIEMVTDGQTQAAFVRTVVLTAVTVIGSMVAALLIALVLNSGLPGMKLLTILVVLPWAMPRVSAAILWKWAFDSQYGVVNWLLSSLGLSMFDGYGWFNSGNSALVVVAVAIIWAKIPFLTIAMLAALKSVPPDIVEAARLDGASAFKVLLRIKVPVMRPVIIVLFVLATIQAFQAFDHIYVMTVPPGGPNHSTEILSLLTYLEAFAFLDGGMGSALAMLTFAVLAIVTALYVRLQREETA